MSNMQDLVVSQIEKNTTDAVVLTFDVPAALQSSFQFQAGQYISLETTLAGQQVRRSYSICAAPYENCLQVGIKKVPNGLFSTYAASTLKVGDQLKVSLPEGRFVYVPDSTPKTIAGFASGSGITPIMAIIKEHLKAHSKNQFHLVYGNKSPEQTMFYQALQELATTYASQLSIVWVFSRTQSNGALFGRIDQSVVHYYQKQRNSEAAAYYVCGPEGMLDVVRETLEKQGVPSAIIHRELFHVTSTETPQAVSSDDVSLTVIHDEMQHTLSSKGNVTLLDAALNAKLDVPYSCQGGVCSSCIARVKKGSAQMQTNQILTDSEVEEGLVLTCQAIPQSAAITVDYDDV